MARRDLDDRNTRKLYRNSGGTMIVSLPKEIVDALRWRSGQRVIVKRSGKKISIEDWK